MAEPIVRADTSLSAGTVLPKPAGNILPSPSQGCTVDMRWKQLILLRRLRDLFHWFLPETLIVIPSKLQWGQNLYGRQQLHRSRLHHPYLQGILLEEHPRV
ncbi:unnamed protein product [Timema podura]|uniref:Uncharacterized protein n=1 Tax=Timema podura TaxID=61482 RepID=A0ABN7NZA0_TIMPD|nr:unnamed protein product [Timema podura]